MCRSEYDRVKDNINVKTITFLLPGVRTDTSVFANFKGASVSFLFARKEANHGTIARTFSRTCFPRFVVMRAAAKGTPHRLVVAGGSTRQEQGKKVRQNKGREKDYGDDSGTQYGAVVIEKERKPRTECETR